MTALQHSSNEVIIKEETEGFKSTNITPRFNGTCAYYPCMLLKISLQNVIGFSCLKNNHAISIVFVVAKSLFAFSLFLPQGVSLRNKTCLPYLGIVSVFHRSLTIEESITLVNSIVAVSSI